MEIRKATETDIPALFDIRTSVREKEPFSPCSSVPATKAGASAES